MHTQYTCMQEARAHYADIKLQNRKELVPDCHSNQISLCLDFFFLVRKFEYDFVVRYRLKSFSFR